MTDVPRPKPRPESVAYVVDWNYGNMDNGSVILNCLRGGIQQLNWLSHEEPARTSTQDEGLAGLTLDGAEMSVGLHAALSDATPACAMMLEPTVAAGNFRAQLEGNPMYQFNAPLLATKMSIRLFARDEPTLAVALEELYGATLRVHSDAHSVLAGPLLCALFGLPGVRVVNGEDTLVQDDPEPFHSYSTVDNALLDLAGAVQQPPVMCAMSFAPDMDVAVDVPLFTNFGLLHGAAMLRYNIPELDATHKLWEMGMNGDVRLGINLEAWYTASRNLYQMVHVPVLDTDYSDAVVTNSSDKVVVHWSGPVVGYILTVHPIDATLAGEECDLPDVTGITVSLNGIPALHRNTEDHGVCIKGVRSRSYLFNTSDTPVTDTEGLFHDWFIERRGFNASRCENVGLQIHTDGDHDPFRVRICAITGNMMKYWEDQAGMAFLK